MSNIPEKYYVEIHAPGKFNDAIIAMITNHNGGQCTLEGFDTIAHYINGYICQHPTITPITSAIVSKSQDRVSLSIFESERATHTLTISYNQFKK
jgi:hypothetical protein